MKYAGCFVVGVLSGVLGVFGVAWYVSKESVALTDHD